ncbi:MAG: DUF2924 domain-containing protein [Sphingobium sp.]|jgi:hypothetical protein|nr:DUF2924 domain-containing protein [Sphingobium sp.]MCI1754663.1 DUF2924 domain-containing protein [Sphingobium sp.]MCI2054202.1 DUF2924 domain-containing protein [Sphingobium sp.]
MTLTAELARLETLDLTGLRAEWQRRYGEVPALRSVDLLRRVLTWRMQAAVLGDLDATTRRLLRQERVMKGDGLASGTILMREWLGVRHEVEVVEEGYIHDGKVWKSLSQIARHITGSNWSGPRFFGLRS